MNIAKFLFGVFGIGIFAGLVITRPHEQNVWTIVITCLIGLVGVTLTVDGAMQKQRYAKESGGEE